MREHPGFLVPLRERNIRPNDVFTRELPPRNRDTCGEIQPANGKQKPTRPGFAIGSPHRNRTEIP